MNHEIYVFGSITSGEVIGSSDADILIILINDNKMQRYPSQWSVYTKKHIERAFAEGKLFAWHLYLDSICVYTPYKKPILKRIGKPKKYENACKDMCELEEICLYSLNEIKSGSPNLIYEIGVVQTCLRDIAMTASWYLSDRLIFSKYAPYMLKEQLPLDRDIYEIAILARHASTRGYSSSEKYEEAKNEIIKAPIKKWIEETIREVKRHEHVQK